MRAYPVVLTCPECGKKTKATNIYMTETKQLYLEATCCGVEFSGLFGYYELAETVRFHCDENLTRHWWTAWFAVTRSWGSPFSSFRSFTVLRAIRHFMETNCLSLDLRERVIEMEPRCYRCGRVIDCNNPDPGKREFPILDMGTYWHEKCWFKEKDERKPLPSRVLDFASSYNYGVWLRNYLRPDWGATWRVITSNVSLELIGTFSDRPKSPPMIVGSVKKWPPFNRDWPIPQSSVWRKLGRRTRIETPQPPSLGSKKSLPRLQ